MPKDSTNLKLTYFDLDDHGPDRVDVFGRSVLLESLYPPAKNLSYLYDKYSVEPRLLRVAPPSEADVENALKIISGVPVQEIIAKKDDDSKVEKPKLASTFCGMQDQFIEHYSGNLRTEQGFIGLERVPLNPAISNYFLTEVHLSERIPLLAFHGTKFRNFPSIFSRGLKIPGPSGIPVANGQAHGAGIYTACQNSSFLSRGFCDTGNLLVCGVVDDYCKNSAAIDNLLPEFKKWVWGMGGRLHRFRQPKPKNRLQGAGNLGMIGRLQIHKQGRHVLHIGNAMVVKTESRVAPLWILKLQSHETASHTSWAHGNPNLQKNAIEIPDCVVRRTCVSVTQRAVSRNVVLETEEGKVVVVWLPPQADAYISHIRVKRRVHSKQQSRARANERKAKLESQSMPNFLCDDDDDGPSEVTNVVPCDAEADCTFADPEKCRSLYAASFTNGLSTRSSSRFDEVSSNISLSSAADAPRHYPPYSPCHGSSCFAKKSYWFNTCGYGMEKMLDDYKAQSCPVYCEDSQWVQRIPFDGFLFSWFVFPLGFGIDRRTCNFCDSSSVFDVSQWPPLK